MRLLLPEGSGSVGPNGRSYGRIRSLVCRAPGTFHLAFKLVDPGSMSPDIRGMDHQSRPDSEPPLHRTGSFRPDPSPRGEQTAYTTNPFIQRWPHSIGVPCHSWPHGSLLRATFPTALLYAYWAYLAYLQNHHGGVEQRPALEG